MDTLEQKKEKAAKAIAVLDKEYGKGSVMALGEKPQTNVEVISTGSVGLDIALGVGGLPKGRVVEIYGPESSGKTTLAIHIMAEAQKLGGLCAVVDAEHAFDRDYAAALGIDIDNLYINQPSSGEEALEVVDGLAGSGAYDVILVDSVAALVPKSELEGQMGDSKMGLHARLMSQALRKITHTVFVNNVLVIFINQLRDKIGVMFGNPETTTGGNALKFYSSVRLDVRRSTTTQNSVMEGDVKIGNQTTVKVIKNKLAPPFKSATFNIIFGHGIDKVGEIIRICSENGSLKKWGQTITFGEFKYTLPDFTALVNDNEDFYKELKASANKV